MARACTTCHHPDREVIDAAIVERTSYRAIARQHGLSKDAVARHVAHVSQSLMVVHGQREEASAASLLERIERLIRRAETFLSAAEKGGQVAVGLNAIREIRALLELLGKASGELKAEGGVSVTVTNVLASAEFIEAQTILMAALQPFPDARIAAAEALDRLER